MQSESFTVIKPNPGLPVIYGAVDLTALGNQIMLPLIH